jgi:chemotaxis protein CheD
MFTESDTPIAKNYFLKPGYIILPKHPTVISTVVGSCIAVCIYDKNRKSGGMNHFQLPRFPQDKPATARYGDVSTLTLIRMMITDGAGTKHLEAQIFGGAHNPKLSKKNIGRENLVVARKIVVGKGIKIVSEDVGGEKGRKIVFNTGTNEIGVLKVEKLREEDWFPYESNR